MGLTKTNLKLKKNEDLTENIDLEFLIDSGASYSLVPTNILKKLHIEPKKEMSFVLADGTSIKRKIGNAYFILDSNEAYSPVIFGEKGDEPLLGAVTLENMGLMLDPFQKKLHPMKLMLA
jgi:clan AA aspartic protease